MNKEEISPYYEETTDGYRRLTYKEVVEDLQQEIERLNEYISFYEDLSKKQNKEIERLKKREKELEENLLDILNISIDDNNKISEAIEYIDNHSKYLGENDYLWDLTTDEVSELVDILKEKEEER